jgi:hypothetical protein
MSDNVTIKVADRHFVVFDKRIYRAGSSVEIPRDYYETDPGMGTLVGGEVEVQEPKPEVKPVSETGDEIEDEAEDEEEDEQPPARPSTRKPAPTKRR